MNDPRPFDWPSRELEEDFAVIFEDDKRETELSDPRYIEQQLEEDFE
jgi:hypothetical protein